MNRPVIVSDLYPATLEALRNRGHDDKAIAAMHPNDIFREFCTWHGLLGWADTLISVLDNARAVKATKVPAR